MSNYWKKRAVQRMYEAMELAEMAADEIGKIYLKASRYISYKSDEIFEKFRKDHNLSEAEARRLITKMHDKVSLDEMERLISESKIKNKKIIPELESRAYRARLERLRQLQNELDLVMRDVYLQEKQFTTSFYTDLANDTFYKTMYDIQQRAGIALTFSHISEKQINKVLSMKWSGQNYSKRIWKNTQELADVVKEELLVNLLTGRTNREAAEIIMNKFASGAAKARRLIRTESNFISSELNNEAYKEAGIEEYQYLATLDLRTSEVCRELDGKIFKVSERKVGVNCNPMHPWCRSTTVPVVDREFLSDGTRSARDSVTGKAIKVPASMNYKEWYKKFVEGNDEAKTAEKKLKNKSADRKQHEKYKEILGDDVPDNLDDFQKMKYNKSEKWTQLQNEAGLLRKTKNSGAFKHLAERMSKKHIRKLAKESGIGLEGISITIDESEELLRLPIAGRADPENVGGITFFPNAFQNKRELVLTLFHEREHVMQFKEYGVEYVQNHRKEFEDMTYSAEKEFAKKMEKEGIL